MQGITACGAASTEMFPQQEPLELTQHQGMEGVLYTVSCTVVPDRMYEILAEWDSGRGDARGFYGEACYLVVTE